MSSIKLLIADSKKTQKYQVSGIELAASEYDLYIVSKDYSYSSLI